MARWRGGKWRGRLNKGQIEELAVRKIRDFRRKLEEAGLAVPEIPPVPVEYIALTLTELSVSGVENLSYSGKSLSGLLDMDRAEIFYEEKDVPGRRNFTIAHELGHYFLHYLPAVELARQPTLFDTFELSQLDLEGRARLEREESSANRFFRCTEQSVTVTPADDQAEESEALPPAEETGQPGRIGRRELEEADSKAYLARILRQKELADRVEWEANIFASGLLMPSDLLRRLNKQYAGDVSAIAALLGVTPAALRYRMNGLKLRQDENMGLGVPGDERFPDGPNRPRQGSFF